MTRTLERRTTSKIKPIFDFFFSRFSINNAAGFGSITIAESSSLETITESAVVVDGRERRTGVTIEENKNQILFLYDEKMIILLIK